ncbi:NAD(P)-binding protein [Periconia macrospinosa]|uniref:NAD(P)-binding protein n=1 Tax=Periconia macrospinosa TaxID=97972 RepID=A0A2V1DHJ1_9PLEO|nr:NAD(P)-binding protein [Periconia macrospinosa]
MRALVRAGDKSTLTLDPNHPEPTSSEHPDCYLIRPRAAAICRGELQWPEPLTPNIPVPGLDFVGEIISTPTATETHLFEPGDQVFALTTHTWKGNAREITVSHERELARKPKNLSWEEAASVPMSALSAYQGLFVHGGLVPPGQGHNGAKRVLVTAASGGVGIWGIQLAHQAAVTELVGTCGTTNVEFVKSLGAGVVLDYRNTNIVDWVEKDWATRAFDVVLDCAGGQTLSDAWKCVRENGKVISVAEPPDGKRPLDGTREGVEGIWFIVKPNGKQLEDITKLIEQGKCRAVVDSVFDLEEFKAAFARSEGGHTRGKVVFRVS